MDALPERPGWYLWRGVTGVTLFFCHSDPLLAGALSMWLAGSQHSGPLLGQSGEWKGPVSMAALEVAAILAAGPSAGPRHLA